MTILGVAVLGSLMAAAPLLATGASAGDDPLPAHAGHDRAAPARLVQLVRDATRRFLDVNAATGANYQPFLGCVSGPDRGAMGVHYVNGDLVADGKIDVTQPEALIYEAEGGLMRLVGVEFIVDAAAWMASHTSPPVLEGQTFQFVNSPNRFGLAAYFELHVWAWRDSPNGAFVDWNTNVSCEGQ